MSYLPTPQANTSSYPVFMYAIMNKNIYLPCKSVEVEQTSYGTADTLTITTPLSITTTDLGALTQQVSPCPISIYVAFNGPNGVQPHLVMSGLTDELENDETSDVITIKGRGLLASLVDARISVKPNMNSTVTNVITTLIQTYTTLTPNVTKTSVIAGTILKEDYVSMSRNLRALDFIQILARSQGWTVRVVNGTITVGPPPDINSAFQLPLSWRGGDWLTLKVTHNALHNRNIHVKVVSYVQGSKHKNTVRSTQGPVAAMLGLPLPISKSSSTSSSVRGGVISGSTSVGERDNVEEYVIPVPGLDRQSCLNLAQSLADEINRHEFVATGTFTTSQANVIAMCQNSPDFNIPLSGCSQASNNGLYYMKHVGWKWDIDSSEGLEFDVEMVNHILPVPSGGQANATVGDVDVASGT